MESKAKLFIENLVMLEVRDTGSPCQVSSSPVKAVSSHLNKSYPCTKNEEEEEEKEEEVVHGEVVGQYVEKAVSTNQCQLLPVTWTMCWGNTRVSNWESLERT